MTKKFMVGLISGLIFSVLLSFPVESVAKSSVHVSKSGGGGLPSQFVIYDDPTLYEVDPVIAYNTTRQQYLVVWVNDRPGNDDLRGIRLDRNGKTIGSPFYISAGSGAERFNPQIAYDTNNDQYLVVWEQYSENYNACLGIYGRLVSGTGAVLGISDIIIRSVTSEISATHDPAVDYASTSNNFLVVWEEESHVNPESKYWIIARVVGIDGSLPIAQFIIAQNSGITYIPLKPELAYNRHANRFLVVWQDLDDFWGVWAVKGHQVHGAGGLYQSQINIAYYSNVSSMNPKVAAIPISPSDEKFLVAYEVHWSPGVPNIYYLMVDEDGTLGSGTYLTSDYSIHPAVAGNESSLKYLVVWQYDEDISNDGIGAREVTHDSMMPSPSAELVSEPGAIHPAVAAGPTGDFLIVFENGDTDSAILGRLWGIRVFLPMINQ